MSGMMSDPNPAAAAPGSMNAMPPVKSAWWKRALKTIGAAYAHRPLLYGFFTVLGLTLLVAGLSPLLSSSPGGPRSGLGRQETPAARLQVIADSMRRMDEFGQMPYAQMLRDTLNPWMRQLKPPGAWEPDPYLFEIFPDFQIAARERQRLTRSIAELEKKFKPSDGKKAVKSPPPTDKDAALLLQDRADLQKLDARVTYVRTQLTQELSALTFSLEDVFIIEGAVWMREVSNRLRERLAARSRGAVDSLALAQELFDWTVRNVAVERKDKGTEQLWESLLWGRGPAGTRAWIFIELCRQQGLDAVMLGYRDPKDPGNRLYSRYQDWVPAVILSRGQAGPELYLFDHEWGIPIPGPGGQGVATLAQAAASPDVLEQLPGYPVRASQLQDVVAMLDVSSYLVARRMQVLEDELRTIDRLVLTVELGKQAARLLKIKGIARVEAWPWPIQCEENARRQPPEARMARLASFTMKGVEEKGRKNETLKQEARFQELAYREQKEASQAPGGITLEAAKREERQQEVSGFLWRGRMLHFRGAFADADDSRTADRQEQGAANAPRKGAANVYQSGRITDRELDELTQDMQTDVKTLEKIRQERRLSFEQAATLDRLIEDIHSAIRQAPAVRLDRQFVRLIATGWVGQVAYERGDYADAAAYFRHLLDVEAPALEKSLNALPEKPSTDMDRRQRQDADEFMKPMLAVWQAAANYHLARALEAAGRYQEAIDAYNKDSSIQIGGSRYRARQLEARLTKTPEAPEGSKSKGKPTTTGAKQ